MLWIFITTVMDSVPATNATIATKSIKIYSIADWSHLTIWLMSTLIGLIAIILVVLGIYTCRRLARRDVGGSPAIEMQAEALDVSIVDTFPVSLFSCEGHEEREECSICITDFAQGENVTTIPHCGHIFHPHCIRKWAAVQQSCPLCRDNSAFS